MPNTPAPAQIPYVKNNKRAFWISDSLYEQIHDYVSRHRNSPEDLTINQFVRDALVEHLERSLKREGGKRARA